MCPLRGQSLASRLAAQRSVIPSRRMDSHSIFNDPLWIVALLVVVTIIALLVWGLGRLCVAYPGARRPLLFAVISLGGAAGYNVLRTSAISQAWFGDRPYS
jgi:hypothetical protein